MKYIAIIDLGDEGNSFAKKIGIRAILDKVYICAALNFDGEKMNEQPFSLAKCIDGLPNDENALRDDVLRAWRTKAHLSA